MAGPAVSVTGVCPFCQTVVEPGDEGIACTSCGIGHHADCWRENTGCGVYGCAAAPAVENRNALEIPVSYWGQERKPCPKCGESIMAAALRCRKCGTVFETTRPLSSAEAWRMEKIQQQSPGVRRGAVWLFVFCVVPLTAPLAFLIGLPWYRRRRDVLARQPTMYFALCRLGLGIAAAQSLFALVMFLIYAAVRGA
jgi:hypothetical protein